MNRFVVPVTFKAIAMPARAVAWLTKRKQPLAAEQQANASKSALRALVSAALLAAIGTVCAAPAPVHTLAQAPARLVAAVTQTLAADAATDPAYALDAKGCTRLPVSSKRAGLAACFTPNGARFHVGTRRLRLHLAAWGRAGHLHPAHLSRGTPKANRITYRASGLREWWRALPLGYEQGFTLSKLPAGHGEVVLQLTASAAPGHAHGNLAWGPLRYGKLEVIDAAGRVLPSHLTTRGRTVALTFDAHHARLPVTVDPMVWNQQELTASNGAGGDHFGFSVALSADADTALVGAHLKTINGASEQGAAYIYTYDAATGAWAQSAELTNAAGAAGDHFGSAVALSANGTVAVIGAPGADGSKGDAYLYIKPSGGWASTSSPAAKLIASNSLSKDAFGGAVALSADGAVALIGASRQAVNGHTVQGAAYVYTEPTAGWVSTLTQSAELIASNGAADDELGDAVALSGNGSTALLGALGVAVNGHTAQGAAYVYTEPTAGWASTLTQSAELIAGNGEAYDEFGSSVALSTDGLTALIGAPEKTINGTGYVGAAYLYAKPAAGWASTLTQSAELTDSRGVMNDGFSDAVALSAHGAIALVGEGNKTVGGTSSQGAAFVYTEPPSGWASTSTDTAELTASNGASGDFFANTLALSNNGSVVLAGAPQKTVGGNSNEGAAYVLTDPYLSTVLNAPSSVTPSNSYTVDAIVTNNGSATSADLKVQMPVPSGTSYDSSSTTQGTCTYDSTTQVATCDLGRLAGSGSMATAQLKLTPTATSGTLTQTAAVYGSPTLSQSATSTVSSGSGSGAIGLWTLLALAMMGFVQRRRRQ